MNKQYISKKVLKEVNNVLMMFFGISLKRKDGTYKVIKHFPDGFNLGHYPSETKEDNIEDNVHTRFLSFNICEYAYLGGNYKMHLIEGADSDGIGNIRLLIEDKDKIWDLYCSNDGKKGTPHIVLSLKRKDLTNTNYITYMDAPGTFVKPTPNGVVDDEGIKRKDVTAVFYFLGEALLYTTFDGIYLKRYTEDDEPYFERCSEILSRDNLIEVITDLNIRCNAYLKAIEKASSKVPFDYSDEDIIVLEEFLASRVDEFITSMKNDRRTYLRRLKALEDSESDTKTNHYQYMKRYGFNRLNRY